MSTIAFWLDLNSAHPNGKKVVVEFKTQNEAYTSKCDHLAGEPMKHHDTYLGKRSPRGLFKSSTGKVLNADVNGALGIMIKSIGKRDIVSRLNSGTVTVPRRIRLREIQQTSSMRLAQNIFGSIQTPACGK